MGNEQRSGSTSVLSQNIRLTGEVTGPENIQIFGYIQGLIKVDGTVTIEENGVVEADVQASDVVVQGKLMGNVIARHQLEIHESGQFVGNVEAAAIDIREGAIFEGRSKMIKTKAAVTAPAPKPAKARPVPEPAPEPEPAPKAKTATKVKGGWHPQAVASYKGQAKLSR